MGKNILIILMVAFGLFAVIMFVLFYAYLKKYYNNKRLNDDFEKEIDNEPDDDIVENSNIENQDEILKESFTDEENVKNNIDEPTVEDEVEEGFIPIRKG